MLKNIPWVSLIGAFWAAIRLNWWGLDIAIGYSTSFGSILLVLAIGALIWELFKSTDIRGGNFYLDLTFALLTLGGAVYTITILDQRDAWDLIDLIIFGVLAADAWVSPMMAYRTALRDVAHSSH
jgi:hypothetical protein